MLFWLLYFGQLKVTQSTPLVLQFLDWLGCERLSCFYFRLSFGILYFASKRMDESNFLGSLFESDFFAREALSWGLLGGICSNPEALLQRLESLSLLFKGIGSVTVRLARNYIWIFYLSEHSWAMLPSDTCLASFSPFLCWGSRKEYLFHVVKRIKLKLLAWPHSELHLIIDSLGHLFSRLLLLFDV